jgi:hypothetical protein
MVGTWLWIESSARTIFAGTFAFGSSEIAVRALFTRLADGAVWRF